MCCLLILPWQEDPGESLSDSEKEEENLDGPLKVDDEEEESEDGFFVPR